MHKAVKRLGLYGGVILKQFCKTCEFYKWCKKAEGITPEMLVFKPDKEDKY